MKNFITLVIVLVAISSSAVASEPKLAHNGDVEISRFSVARIQDIITLNWNTEGERNNLGFEIERKSQFEEQWTTIGFMRGRGTASGEKEYAFVEKLNSREVLLYRLKQIDTYGNALYSQAVIVTPDKIPASMRVSPGLNRHLVEYNRISFALPKGSGVIITVHDIFGRILRTVVEEHFAAGYHVIPFGSVSLPAGLYNVRLQTRDGVLTRTLIKSS